MTADEEDAEARRYNLVSTDPGILRARDKLLQAIFVTVLLVTLIGLIGGNWSSP